MIALVAGAGAVGGAIVGSFLATICVRWPEGRQALAGRSSCDHCGRVLGPLELVPVLSAALARGRCRGCGGQIAALHMKVEVSAAALAALALVLEPNATGLALATFWLLLIAPAVLDARHFWLPNALTAVIAAGGLLIGGHVTGAGMADRLIGGIAGFAALELLRAGYMRLRGREGLGAGDPKLLGAIGLWTGSAALPALLVIASTTGLVVALAQRRTALDRLPFGSLLAFSAILWTAFSAWLGGSAF